MARFLNSVKLKFQRKQFQEYTCSNLQIFQGDLDTSTLFSTTRKESRYLKRVNDKTQSDVVVSTHQIRVQSYLVTDTIKWLLAKNGDACFFLDPVIQAFLNGSTTSSHVVFEISAMGGPAHRLLTHIRGPDWECDKKSRNTFNVFDKLCCQYGIISTKTSY